MDGTIFDLRRYSIHDGPGIRTAVFFKGCPLACPWCHNPEGRSYQPELIFRPALCILCDDCLTVCPQEAVSRAADAIRIDRAKCRVSGLCAAVCPAEALEVVGKRMTVEAVMRALERDRIFYEQSGGGVTFTGGEPLAQAEFLGELLTACRQAGLHTAVDTCGYAPSATLEALHGGVDLFLFDLKLMDATRHAQWMGVPNDEILANLARLSAWGHVIEVRLPLIPGVNDDEANLQAVGKFLAALPRLPRVRLLAYHDIAAGKYAALGGEYALKIEPPGAEKMEQCAASLRAAGLEVLR